MSEQYLGRINYNGDYEQLASQLSEEFNLGTPSDSKVLTVGFEDCNVKVETNNGCFVIKAFSKLRDDAEIQRYVGTMKAAIAGEVHHPTLHAAKSGDVLYNSNGLSAVVMDFINGQTYFDSRTVPTDEELNLIAAEAVKIHNLDLHPDFLVDSWAIPQIHKMYQLVEQFLDEDDKQLAQQAIRRYDTIDQQKLQRCFVHGDIMATNTLKGLDGKIWILDFAVANIYPKIQELAVIASSLLTNGKDAAPLSERTERIRKAYLAAGGTLSDYEQTALLDYAIAGATMELLGGHKAKFIDKEDPEESDHWVQLGKETLQTELK